MNYSQKNRLFKIKNKTQVICFNLRKTKDRGLIVKATNQQKAKIKVIDYTTLIIPLLKINKLKNQNKSFNIEIAISKIEKKFFENNYN